MSEQTPRDVRELPDEELRTRYLADDPADNAEVFIAIYSRYRDVIRSAMRNAGLPAAAAERRVGHVFLRGMEHMRMRGAESRSLREHLLEQARLAASDPDWKEA